MHSRWRSIPCSPTSGTTCRRRRATTRWRGSGPSILKSLDSWSVMNCWSWSIEVLKISLQSPSKRISIGCVNSLCKDTESRNLEKSFLSYCKFIFFSPFSFSRIIIERKVSHYIITYYIPSGLFVVVSWASFLIPCDDIQVNPVAIPRVNLERKDNFKVLSCRGGKKHHIITRSLYLVI